MGDYIRTRLAILNAAPEMQKYLDIADFGYMMARVCQIQVGTYTGSGVAQAIVTDGNPIAVLLVDDTQTTHALNFRGMADASYRVLSTGAVVAANGITLGTNGFTIGTAAGINSNLDTGFWIAFIA